MRFPRRFVTIPNSILGGRLYFIDRSGSYNFCFTPPPTYYHCGHHKVKNVTIIYDDRIRAINWLLYDEKNLQIRSDLNT